MGSLGKILSTSIATSPRAGRGAVPRSDDAVAEGNGDAMDEGPEADVMLPLRWGGDDDGALDVAEAAGP